MTAPLTAPTCNTSITTDQPPAPLPCGLIPESTCRAKSETPHDVAAKLLVAAGDNPDRLHSEAAFAHLCGVAPLEASSGKTRRHRLNRGGNRQANSALYRVVITRMASHPPTRNYVARRRADGKSTGEIIRILKRYVAREAFKHLQPAVATAT